MKKPAKVLFFLTIAALSLTGCNGDEGSVSSKLVGLSNLSSDYAISNKNVTVYFLDGDESTPYVSVKSFLSDLNGYFNKSAYSIYKSLFSNTLSVSSYGASVSFDWENDEIKVNNTDIFYYIVNSSSTTNYSSYLKTVKSTTEGKQTVNFKLSNYGYKVHKKDSEILVPLTVMNTLFCSPNYLNLFYRGNMIFSYVGEIHYSDPEYQVIYDSQKSQQTQALRDSTINSLCFTFDYFYGLKEDKGITSFRDYITKDSNDILNGLKSTSAADNRNAYKSLLMGSLDDLHTRVDSVGFYYPNIQEAPTTRDDYGDFGHRYYASLASVSSLRNARFPESMPAVRFFGDTAIITLDEFMTGTNSEIFDASHNVKSDAWKYDSYWYMQECMNQIESHGNINDILLDISLNGGGNIGALIRVYGFITDKRYLDYGLDTLTQEKSCYEYLIDTDRDNDYEDNDSYDQYRWTILSGTNTFSAANALITKIRQQNVAKVIGQQSGGGMCSVLPTVLQDGTAIALSSQNTIRLYKDGLFKSTEYGHAPDLTVAEADFYNDEKLVEYIDQVYGD